MKAIKKNILILLILSSFLFGQNIELTQDYFYDLQSYHLTDFDFDNAALNPDFFSYTLRYNDPDNNPIDIRVEFEMVASLPAFGLDESQLLYIMTNPFPFLGSVNLTSRDIDLEMDKLTYTSGPLTGQAIDFNGVDTREYMNESKFNSIKNEIMAMGELPEGEYIFRLTIYDRNRNRLTGDQKVVRISNPEVLDLIEPGGQLSDNMEIFTTYPVFRWDMNALKWSPNYCSDCGLYIRVAEYLPSEHSTLEEALDSPSFLPFPDNNDYYKIDPEPVLSSSELVQAPEAFSYPTIDAKPLEEGKYYVWQIKKVYPTTSGRETIFSPIWTFQIAGESEGGTITTTTSEEDQSSVKKILPILEEMLGAQQINTIIQTELENYELEGQILLNNRPIELEKLKEISDKVLSNEINIKTITVK